MQSNKVNIYNEKSPLGVKIFYLLDMGTVVMTAEVKNRDERERLEKIRKLLEIGTPLMEIAGMDFEMYCKHYEAFMLYRELLLEEETDPSVDDPTIDLEEEEENESN